MSNTIFYKTNLFFRRIDKQRDKILFPLVIKYWPRFILPNYLSGLRIIIAIVIILSLVYYTQLKPYILLFYLIGVFLDIIDGTIARALKQRTKTGDFLDPLADKLLNGVIAIYLLWQKYKILLFTLFILEGIAILGSLVGYFLRKSTRANVFGKVKMCLQSGAFLIILFWSAGLISLAMLWLSAALAAISLILKYLKWFKKENA